MNRYEKSMSKEKENIMQKLENARRYDDLKKKLYTIALIEFEKSKTRYQTTFRLGIHEIPIGYVGVREPNDNVGFGMPHERFFWINCEGKKSEHFDTKWEVYLSAKLNLPFRDSLAQRELDLIQKFDPHFGRKSK